MIESLQGDHTHAISAMHELGVRNEPPQGGSGVGNVVRESDGVRGDKETDVGDGWGSLSVGTISWR